MSHAYCVLRIPSYPPGSTSDWMYPTVAALSRHLVEAALGFDRPRADPVDAAVLLFQAASREAVERFAARDPYVLNGLVKSWRVREWTTVIGPEAAVRI